MTRSKEKASGTSTHALRQHRSAGGLTIPHYAELLDVHEGIIRRAVDRGDLPVTTFAGRRRISPNVAVAKAREIWGRKLALPAQFAPIEEPSMK